MQDYYKILEVGYDASEEAIRSSYIRLALVSVCSNTVLYLCFTFLNRPVNYLVK